MASLLVIAITAASGQLGRATISGLRERGAQNVVGLTRAPAKAADLGIEVRLGSYDDPSELAAAFSEFEMALLISGNEQSEACVAQHRNVIEAARAADVRRMVFTSVQGIDSAPEGSVRASFLEPEADLKASGMARAIGRNGVYIEPDIEFADNDAREGEIANSAGAGRCGYKARGELGVAYAGLLRAPELAGRTYSLSGAPLTQAELAAHIGLLGGVPIRYRAMTSDAYLADRTEALGPELGPIIAGMYDQIRAGHLDLPSSFAAAAGRQHVKWASYFAGLPGAAR